MPIRLNTLYVFNIVFIFKCSEAKANLGGLVVSSPIQYQKAL